MKTSSNSNPKKVGAEFFSGLLFFALVVLVLGAFVRGCQGPYWAAMRAKKTNPCLAAHLFAEDIRGDTKGALNSVVELTELDNQCALKEFVGLMDIPEGRFINAENRKILWDAFRPRALKLRPTIPLFQPYGPQDARAAEKRQWEDWLKHVGIN